VRESALPQSQRILLTFEPHPRVFFAKLRGQPIDFLPISSFRERFLLSRASGFDFLLAAHFDGALAALTPREFVQQYLVEVLQAELVVVGYDWAFGKGRAGNPDLLKRLGEEFGFRVLVAEPVLDTDAGGVIGGGKISSTVVRGALLEGDLVKVVRYLGRPYMLSGHVRRGDQRGRVIGFPTANLALPPLLLPRNGVYASRLSYAGRSFDSITNIGTRPTFSKQLAPSVETHILGADQHALYGVMVELELVARIRDEVRFSGVDALKQQIAKDLPIAQALLDSAPRTTNP